MVGFDENRQEVLDELGKQVSNESSGQEDAESPSKTKMIISFITTLIALPLLIFGTCISYIGVAQNFDSSAGLIIGAVLVIVLLLGVAVFALKYAVKTNNKGMLWALGILLFVLLALL